MTAADPLDVAAGDDRARPVLLGEAPSRGGDRFHAFPLSGRPARVLCELAGIPPQAEGSQYGRWTWALYERFECANLFDRYADATPWSTPAARVRAAALLDELKPAGPGVLLPSYNVPLPVVVCLGRRVQAALFGALDGEVHVKPSAPARWGTGWFGDFGVWARPWHIYTPIVRPGGGDVPERRWAPHVVTIPHPSGLNRLLNDEAHRARCGEVLRRALELAAPTDTVGA